MGELDVPHGRVLFLDAAWPFGLGKPHGDALLEVDATREEQGDPDDWGGNHDVDRQDFDKGEELIHVCLLGRVPDPSQRAGEGVMTAACTLERTPSQEAKFVLR
jgi:hypothetical protein